MLACRQSLGFLVKRVLAAELAILHEFQSVRVIFLVLLRVVVTLLALGACEGNLDTRFIFRHLAAPPILFDLMLPGVGASVYLPLKGTDQLILERRIDRRFCALPRIFSYAKRRTKKKPFDRGNDIITHSSALVNTFLRIFLLF